MARLALCTFGVLREDWGHPRIQGFSDRVPDTFSMAEASDGFIWRDCNPYGVVAPSFLPAEARSREAPTLSLWRDLASVWAFSYQGLHREALQHRAEWFVKADWPGYVAWWVGDDEVPTWADARQRLELLRSEGSTPAAFTFKTAFDAQGNPLRLRTAAARDVRRSGE